MRATGSREFDRNALEPEAGIRAIWLLYKRGQWGYLEDLGMDRAVAAPAFRAFEAENLIGPKLTKTQCRLLERMVPGLKSARVELRSAYVLKFYELGKKKMRQMKYYHGEVAASTIAKSDMHAESLAAELSERLQLVGGHVDVGRRGDGYAVLILALPEDEPVPAVEGIEWKPVALRHVPLVPDWGIQE